MVTFETSTLFATTDPVPTIEELMIEATSVTGELISPLITHILALQENKKVRNSGHKK
jgi:hypothetical protein